MNNVGNAQIAGQRFAHGITSGDVADSRIGLNGILEAKFSYHMQGTYYLKMNLGQLGTQETEVKITNLPVGSQVEDFIGKEVTLWGGFRDLPYVESPNDGSRKVFYGEIIPVPC